MDLSERVQELEEEMRIVWNMAHEADRRACALQRLLEELMARHPAWFDADLRASYRQETLPL